MSSCRSNIHLTDFPVLKKKNTTHFLIPNLPSLQPYFTAATAHGTPKINPLVSLPPKPPPRRFVLQTTRFEGMSKQCDIDS